MLLLLLAASRGLAKIANIVEDQNVRKYILSAAAVLPLWLIDVDASTAQAQGIHIRSGGIHVDVGSPHRHGHRHYRRGRHYGRRLHGWADHSHWHNTTHLDYHPGGLVRHYDHYDYVPGHFDVHRSGHWDPHF
jgi:hypothetical protein